MRKIKDVRYFVQSVYLSVKLKSPLSLTISILAFGMAFLPMLISLQLSYFTDQVQQLYYQETTVRMAIMSFFLLAGLYILQAFFTFLQNYCVKEDSVRIKYYIKEKIMELMASVPYRYLENNEGFGEKVDFVKTYAGEKAAGSVSLLFGWFASILSFASVAVLLFSINGWMIAVLVGTCIPAVILSFLQQDETYRQRTKWMKEGRLTIHYSSICRDKIAINEIRFLGLYPYLKQKWRNLSQIYVEKKKKIIKKHVTYNSIADFLRSGVYVVVVLMAAVEIFRHPEKGLGTFMLVISASGQLQAITTKLLVNVISILADMKYMKDFFQFLEMEREEESELGENFNQMDIVFENVTFTYPGSNCMALDGVSVEIRQGEKIAVVGANGSGKSTFVNMLCGFYQPDSGKIKVNGDEISEIVSRVRQSISVVFQHFCQYQDTLRNNITISDPYRQEESAIWELAKKTGADEVIQGKDKKLDEMIGIFSESGDNLSGGQWQKIAITRALYRKGVCIYILDEPTAALDPVAEANIYRNFSTMTENKTTILISHRLGITSVVDRILVFDKGRIVEDGSHKDLMNLNGVYAHMYRSQARWYL